MNLKALFKMSTCDTSPVKDAYFLTALQRGTKMIDADAVGDFEMGFSLVRVLLNIMGFSESLS